MKKAIKISRRSFYMFKMLKNLSWKEWLMIAVSILLIVGQVWLDLKLPDYMNEITTLIQQENREMSKVWIAGGYMLACALGSALLSVVVGFFSARIGSALGLNLRQKVYNQIQSYSKSEMKKFSTSSLITRSTSWRSRSRRSCTSRSCSPCK